MVDPRLAEKLNETYRRLQSEGRVPSRERLQQYYRNFRERFGPDRLQALDGEALLETMHAHGNRDSLVYWLEFKNDEEFPAIFGSIAGGAAHKFGVFRSAQTGEWITGPSQNPQTVSVEEAIEIARKHRAQLLRGLEWLQDLPENATDNDYRLLQEWMDTEAPDVSRVAWGHKYFSLLYPDKLDDYHVESFQRFHLVKLLQTPPDGEGRYLCARRYVAAARELDMPLNHLTTVLNHHNGRPHRYWRILANYRGQPDWQLWESMRDGGFVAIGWAKLGDLSHLEANQVSKDQLRALMQEHYNAKGQWVQEVFNFAAGISERDIVLACEKNHVLGVGKVTGPYYYEPKSPAAHRLPVQWLSVEPWELPYDEFSRAAPVVREARQYVNHVEVERHILEAPIKQPGLTPKPVPEVKLSGTSSGIRDILERKGQVILYGPPGTGKTYWAERTARDLAASSAFGKPFAELDAAQQSRVTDHYVRLCTFHPGYGYEDFLEGYRPELSNGQMAFVYRDGIFKQLCEAAQAEPNRDFYLIIDEINRGDIPRIFGELITLLESDKRGKEVLLPLSGRPFAVPHNVYLIGTMNTADRSVALLDTALRRRFGFVELMPNYSLLEDTVVEGIPLGPWLEALNRQIVEHVGRDARNLQIGHAYLMQNGKPITSFSHFVRIVREDLLPLLQEYCYEDYQTLEEILGPGLVDANRQTIQQELFASERQDDLIQALLAPFPDITTTTQAAVSEASEEELEEEFEDEDIEG